jgi:hypothetical protein
MDLLTKIQRQLTQSHPQHYLRPGGGAALFGCGDVGRWVISGPGALPCANALFALELRDLSRVLNEGIREVRFHCLDISEMKHICLVFEE